MTCNPDRAGYREVNLKCMGARPEVPGWKRVLGQAGLLSPVFHAGSPWRAVPESPVLSHRQALRAYGVTARTAKGDWQVEVRCVYSYTSEFWGTMRSVSSREIINALKSNGWVLVEVRGSHHQFRHPLLPGRVTVTHPVKDIPWGTVKSILKQSGLKESDI
jgi:predicted RNA binding protein YcfA (HicA-like mRNA interferase family)